METRPLGDRPTNVARILYAKQHTKANQRIRIIYKYIH